MYSVRELRHKIGEDQLTMPLTRRAVPHGRRHAAARHGRLRAVPLPHRQLRPRGARSGRLHQPLVLPPEGEGAGRARAPGGRDAGRKILRGEDARKLSPSPLTVYGHVDLDNLCEHDYFPEEEPTPPKDVDEATPVRDTRWISPGASASASGSRAPTARCSRARSTRPSSSSARRPRACCASSCRSRRRRRC
jgi:hypothetical protein